MSSKVYSTQIILCDDAGNEIIVRQKEIPEADSHEMANTTRQQLVDFWASGQPNGEDEDEIMQYPTSHTVHEVTMKGTSPTTDDSTGTKSKLIDVTRIYYMTDQGGYHLASCNRYDCIGHPDRVSAQTQGDPEGPSCNPSIGSKWYDLPADPLVEKFSGSPLYDLMSKVERSPRDKSKSSPRKTNRQPVENRIEYNSIMIRPDLTSDYIPFYPYSVLSRYHLPSCTDSLCPGSSDPANATRKGVEGMSRCRPDLKYHFDHAISPRDQDMTQDQDTETSLWELKENLKRLAICDEDGTLVLPEYPIDQNRQPLERSIRLNEQGSVRGFSFGDRMNENGYSIPFPSHRKEEQQWYLADLDDDERTPSSPVAHESVRREVCPQEIDGTERKGTYSRGKFRNTHGAVSRSVPRTPTSGLGRDEDGLFTTSPFERESASQSKSYNHTIQNSGYTYVNPADYLTNTKNVDAQSGEPRIRRSGDSLPSSPNSFQDSIGTSLPQAQTESTPGTYYSPEMGSGRGKSADNRSGARYDSRQSPRAGKGLRRVRKKEQMGLR
ncbi:hypothetical protein I203_107893 [Kwoniella mangroviensis CBS 8507]|uniref:hypothetical protein n=1 Tax=Kwoniella mangroviensis CBS 8507 TaxID=1296122 RepID=UPI00080D0705|nr:uncharacterized protein I203_04787 [Kwoniella mangroviensis CBS 8507]OCF65769.1 hypothetical protein I203_04787 [Kwoniella mangroviensis CBS 8507]